VIFIVSNVVGRRIVDVLARVYGLQYFKETCVYTVI